jgi:hypothetical protein
MQIKLRQEWARNQTTLALKDLCEKEFERIISSPISDNLVFNNPQATQENLLTNATLELCWGTFLNLLEGDWEDLEIEDGATEEPAE